MASSVIGEENHQRILFQAEAAQRGQHAPHPLVHAVHHCRIDGHAQGPVRLVIGLIPRRHIGIARRQPPFRVDDALAQQARITLIAKRVPSPDVGAPVLRDVLGPCVQRPVRRGIGQIQQKRLFAPRLLLQPRDRVVGERVGHVKRLPAGHNTLVVQCKRPLVPLLFQDAPITACAADQPVVAIKAALPGPVFGPLAHMPLAGHIGPVPRPFQHFRERHARAVEIPLVWTFFRRGRPPCHHPAHARLMRVKAGQQRRARRAAPCR